MNGDAEMNTSDNSNTQNAAVANTSLRADAATIAEQIRRVLSEAVALPDSATLEKSAYGSAEAVATSRAFRRLIQLADNLAAEHGAARVRLTITEAVSTGSAHWDAAIAALCEYRLDAENLAVAEWIITRPGTPERPWTPKTSAYNIPADTSDVPNEFLKRGVLVKAATLVSY